MGAIEELVSSADDSDRIFVDIPIGLPNGPEGRLCDREARKRLRGRRAATVFPAPVRAALAADTYEDANRISRDVADDDILDAMAAAITASTDPAALRTLPEHPTMDSRGLPMEMVYVEDLSPHTGESDE